MCACFCVFVCLTVCLFLCVWVCISCVWDQFYSNCLPFRFWDRSLNACLKLFVISFLRSSRNDLTTITVSVFANVFNIVTVLTRDGSTFTVHSMEFGFHYKGIFFQVTVENRSEARIWRALCAFVIYFRFKQTLDYENPRFHSRLVMQI